MNKGRIDVEPSWVRPLAGALASQTADFCTYFLDTSKIRLQLDGELGMKRVYSGTLQAICKIWKQEGFFGGLYKGYSAAFLRQGCYRGVVFALYEPIRDSFGTKSFYAKVLSGGIGGSVGIAMVSPLDLIKVRLQADISGTRYHGVLSACKSVARNEGIRGMFRGVIPNAKRAFLVNASELATYDSLKAYAICYVQDGYPAYCLASLGAGLCAALVSTPVDLVKTRLMNQSAMYSGSFDCLRRTVRSEGFGGLYKGFLPTWIRLGPYNLIAFVMFEKYRKMMNSYS